MRGYSSVFLRVRWLVRWLEVKVGPALVDDVGPAPRLVADQPPRVARAAVVLCEQDIARTDDERRTGFRLKLERAGQGDDEPRDRVLVPLVRSTRPCFLEGQLGDGHGTADEVAARPLFEIDPAFLEQRVAVLAGPHAYTANHSFTHLQRMATSLTRWVVKRHRKNM